MEWKLVVIDRPGQWISDHSMKSLDQDFIPILPRRSLLSKIQPSRTTQELGGRLISVDPKKAAYVLQTTLAEMCYSDSPIQSSVRDGITVLFPSGTAHPRAQAGDGSFFHRHIQEELV